jgi:type IV pilus assembly protein PilB
MSGSRRMERLVLERGLVNKDEWDDAATRSAEVVVELLDAGALDTGALVAELALASGMPPVDLDQIEISQDALDCVPRTVCLDRGVIPLVKNGDVLTVAVCDPFDLVLIDDIEKRTRTRVFPMVTDPRSLRAAIDLAFRSTEREVEELLGEVGLKGSLEVEVKVEPHLEDHDLDIDGEVGDDAPAVRMINALLTRALEEKASDIHIEPGDQNVSVRLRVDGTLSTLTQPPKSLLPAIISRLKVLAELDIAERFRPQDGKFRIRYEGRAIDFRLSLLPVVGGEKAVLRILDSNSVPHRIDSLGYEEKTLLDLRHAIQAAHGLVLVTGPTGSGKSTTLYSCLREIAGDGVNVTTVEDPVEYRMPGINQVQVQPKRGLSFAGALRSILRQDPDVVLVGEIRDLETADIAVKAALTGHLVLSSLHTNDAASSVNRLVDMGVDPYLVASSVTCVAAQRLARQLCDHCRRPAKFSEAELLTLGLTEVDWEGATPFSANPEGCARCHNGYSGRFALVEALRFDEDLRRLILSGSSSHELHQLGMRGGMESLRHSGLKNFLRGKTSLEEILRVTIDDRQDRSGDST